MPRLSWILFARLPVWSIWSILWWWKSNDPKEKIWQTCWSDFRVDRAVFWPTPNSGPKVTAHPAYVRLQSFWEFKKRSVCVLNSSKQSLKFNFKQDCGLSGPNSWSKLLGSLVGPTRMLNLLQVGFGHFKFSIKNPLCIRIALDTSRDVCFILLKNGNCDFIAPRKNTKNKSTSSMGIRLFLI